MTESAQGPQVERAEVSVELHLLRLPNRRIDLIIRRGVVMRDGSGRVAATEELWTVAVQGGTLAAAAVIREELSRVGSALLHGRPPVGLDAPTERDLQRLREDLQGGDVEFVAAVGVTVQDFFAENAVIVDADVVAGRGMAAGAARQAFLVLLTGLGRLPAGRTTRPLNRPTERLRARPSRWMSMPPSSVARCPRRFRGRRTNCCSRNARISGASGRPGC